MSIIGAHVQSGASSKHRIGPVSHRVAGVCGKVLRWRRGFYKPLAQSESPARGNGAFFGDERLGGKRSWG
jgi:hypothetical protein